MIMSEPDDSEFDTAAFDQFWAASELSEVTAMRFTTRMAAFDPTQPPIDPWSRPAAAEPATWLTGRLPELIAGRRSNRRFASKIITDSELGRLLSVLAGPIAGRGYPSAGALYAIRAITIRFSEDRSSGRILQHDPLAHSLTPIGDSPGWSDLVDDLGGHDAESAPAAVVGLYADPAAMLAKYGERGGRFLLMEAGAVLLSLGMAAAEIGLAGYPAGGGHDRRLVHLAGLSGLPARYVVSYFVGHPDD
jgi:hypothetical protein